LTNQSISAIMPFMTKTAVLVEGLEKRFGSVEALKGIDFEVPVGTIFGLLGPNGAGKTTAVRILSTIIRPDAGRAEVLGHDVVRDDTRVRHLIGLAGQNAAVDPNLTGLENLRLIGKLAQLPRRIAKQRAGELLDRFDLAAAGDRPIKTYSGGMRRRLDVAAALVAKPPVLFLDEPTTGLDIQSRTELWAVIRELVADGSTVLLTTQYLEEADQLADRIAVVHGGLVVANDTADALKARLGSTIIEIRMAGEDEALEAEGLLARMAYDHPERDGAKVRLSTNQAPAVLMNVLRALDRNGMVPAGISVHEPSLDDVFLNLTGRPADAEEVLPVEATEPSGDGAQQAKTSGQLIETHAYQPPVVKSGQELERQDPAERLHSVLAALPYKAGEGTVLHNLEEVAEAALMYYQDGESSPARRPLDLSPISGYLLLEQRFGRISGRASPEQAASVLVGAVAARALGLAAKSGRDSEYRGNGERERFARDAAQILLQGIGASESERSAT
jgi:ABC-2 type transport system ATP-binding protein